LSPINSAAPSRMVIASLKLLNEQAMNIKNKNAIVNENIPI
jgi:hypothetical protein